MARPRGDIDVRVVRAAHDRFLREGVDGASLRAIARDAETSVGMVYYYFPTKDDLFAAVVEDVYAKFLDDLAGILDPPAPLADRLQRVYVRLGAATTREREVLRLVLREALVSSTRLDRLIARFRQGHLPLLLGAMADGVAAGDVDPAIPLPVAAMLAGVLGVAAQVLSREIAPRVHFDVPEGAALAAVLVERVFHGIAPRPGVVAARGGPTGAGPLLVKDSVSRVPEPSRTGEGPVRPATSKPRATRRAAARRGPGS